MCCGLDPRGKLKSQTLIPVITVMVIAVMVIAVMVIGVVMAVMVIGVICRSRRRRKSAEQQT